jgi:hypothetical protein
MTGGGTVATYSRRELESMRAQLDEQMIRFVDAYNDRYPGDMAAPPLEYADLKSKIADYYSKVAEIDRWMKQTADEAFETGWLYDSPIDNDVKLFAGLSINTRGKWKVDRAGVVREFTSEQEAREWAKSYWN